MSATTDSQRTALAEDAINESFLEAMRRGTFAPATRAAQGFADREDRLQEALCTTWLAFRRQALEEGEFMPDALLAFIARRHVRCLRTRFAPRARQREHADVYDLKVLRCGVAHVPLHEQHGCTSEPDCQLTTRLDLVRLAAMLDTADQAVLQMAGSGHTTREVAAELNVSPATAFRWLERVRAKLRREVAHG